MVPGPGGTKILLVDDEEGIRKVLEISLSELGYTVLTAESAETALAIFEGEAPPIVLTDIKMPGMDGLELLQRVKAMSPDTEVIMITGYGEMDLAVKSLKLEATDFITKPLHVDALEIALKRAEEKISTRKRLRAYTENLEASYQQLFDEAPCYISVQDREFRIVSSNRRFKEDFSHPSGAFCYQAYRQRSSPCPDCPVEATFRDGVSRHSEMVVTSRSGAQCHLLVWTAPLRNTKGEIIQVMEMSTDITRIRQLQDHLSSLGLLLGSVSHSVKGLLTGLDGGMYLLDSGFSKENRAQIREGWEIVKLTVGRIRRMVLDILYYARERDLKWERVDVIGLVEEIAEAVEAKMRSQGIRMTTEFDRSLGSHEIDAGVIRSALSNLLENAAEACLARKTGNERRVVFRAYQDEENIIFEVRDNGIGMDAETRGKLFTPLFSRQGEKGTGLGLFITSRIIQQHGGKILVDSEPGQGTCMRIRLPKIYSVSA